MCVDSWQNNHFSHTPSGNCGGVITPTFVVTPPEAETASTHSYLEVPTNYNRCLNDPAPDEICKCEKEAMRSKKEAMQGVDNSAGNTSPSVKWKAEVIRQYRERLEQRQREDISKREEQEQLDNGLPNSKILDRRKVYEISSAENGLDSSSTCSTLEADCDSFSSSPQITESCNTLCSNSECIENKFSENDNMATVDKLISSRNNNVQSDEIHSKLGKLTNSISKQSKLSEEEKNKKIREVEEIVSSLESIPATFKEVDIDVDRSFKYKVPFGLQTSSVKGKNIDVCRSNPSVVKWKDDFISSMLNLDLSRLNDTSSSSSCHSSLSYTNEISPRDLIFGCGRVAELARHFTQLGESEKCNVRRSKSEPDISPRTDKRRPAGDYTVYSVGLKAVDLTVHHNEDSNLSPKKLEEVTNSADYISHSSQNLCVEKVFVNETNAHEYTNGRSQCDQCSSSSEDSDSPWVQLRRLLHAESLKTEEIGQVFEDDLEDSFALKVEPGINMWARMKKLVKGGASDETSGQVSTSWMYRTDVKNKSDKNKQEKRTKKTSLDSTYLSFDVTAKPEKLKQEKRLKKISLDSSYPPVHVIAQEPVMRSSNSENCLVSSTARETQQPFLMRGERSRSEEALLQKKKPKRRVVFSCVQENSDGEKSPSILRYSVTKPNSLEHGTSSEVHRYSVTKPISEVKPKFPEAYIRTRTCQSVEDLRNKAIDNPSKPTLARQFVSMPHIMHPLYIGGHTHLIPIRANSDEMLCRHLHCGHLNRYYYPCEWLQVVKA